MANFCGFLAASYALHVEERIELKSNCWDSSIGIVPLYLTLMKNFTPQDKLIDPFINFAENINIRSFSTLEVSHLLVDCS